MKGKLTLKYDHWAKSHSKQPVEESDVAIESDILMHDTESSTRTICFVLKTGEKVGYNYSQLGKCSYSPETNTITLDFSGDEIVINGERLDGLFKSLLQQQPKEIKEVDRRYTSIAIVQFIVNEIKIRQKS